MPTTDVWQGLGVMGEDGRVWGNEWVRVGFDRGEPVPVTGIKPMIMHLMFIILEKWC